MSTVYSIKHTNPGYKMRCKILRTPIADFQPSARRASDIFTLLFVSCTRSTMIPVAEDPDSYEVKMEGVHTI